MMHLWTGNRKSEDRQGRQTLPRCEDSECYCSQVLDVFPLNGESLEMGLTNFAAKEYISTCTNLFARVIITCLPRMHGPSRLLHQYIESAGSLGERKRNFLSILTRGFCS